MHVILTHAFAPSELDIRDESALHAGHAGSAPAGETHAAVTIRSAALHGLSRLEAQRRINDALAGEFASGLHALRIRVLAENDRTDGP